MENKSTLPENGKRRLAHDMAELFTKCGCKHKTHCFAGSCEECISRFLNRTHYEDDCSAKD